MKKQGQQVQQNMKKKYVKPEMTVIHMPGVSLLGVSGERSVEYAEQDFSKKNNSNGLFDSDIEDEGNSTRPFHEYLWE